MGEDVPGMPEAPIDNMLRGYLEEGKVNAFSSSPVLFVQHNLFGHAPFQTLNSDS